MLGLERLNTGVITGGEQLRAPLLHRCHAHRPSGPAPSPDSAPSRRAVALLFGQVLLTAGTASAIDLDNLSQLQKQQLSACPQQAQRGTPCATARGLLEAKRKTGPADLHWRRSVF